MNPTAESDKKIVDFFYYMTSFPVQSLCTVGKRFGTSTWRKECGAYDISGEAYVCLDNVHRDLTADSSSGCLVYSYGAKADLGFEKDMAKLGKLELHI